MADHDRILPLEGELPPVSVDIEDEMKRSYIDYAMSVIVGRALPDVRDGLKPVHARVLFGMWEAGNTSTKAYKKSARIVGEVMGKFHPHGDRADLRHRGPYLVDGQGNFGSIDGDSPAAMRYTEVRLTKLAEEMLKEDIGKETVDWADNYDGTLQEPTSSCRPGYPNLLVNGSDRHRGRHGDQHSAAQPGGGPRRLLMLIDNPAVDIEGLMTVTARAPDFPTAGFIHGQRRDPFGLSHRSRRDPDARPGRSIETRRRGGDRQSIIVSEIPYQVNKSRLVERSPSLVRAKKLEGISDLRDESDRDGIRIVIDIKRGECRRSSSTSCYKMTPMQSTFGIICWRSSTTSRRCSTSSRSSSTSSTTARRWSSAERGSICARPRPGPTSSRASSRRSTTSTRSSPPSARARRRRRPASA